MRKILFLSVLVSTAALLVAGCSKEDQVIDRNSREVEYRASGSPNMQIVSVAYTNIEGDLVTVSNVESNTWTSSKLTVPLSLPLVSLTVNGISIDGQTAELKAEIVVDGEVEREDISTGTTLIAQTDVTFVAD